MSLEPNPRPDEISTTTGPVRPSTPAEQKTGEPQVVTAGQPAHKSILREYAEAIIIAMLLAFAIRVFVVQAFKIPSGSMIPTLLVGDHILVSKLSYGLQWPADCKFQPGFPPVTCYSSRTLIPFGSIQRGDIIVACDGQSERVSESQLIGRLLRERRVGELVPVRVLRGTAHVELSLPMQ